LQTLRKVFLVNALRKVIFSGQVAFSLFGEIEGQFRLATSLPVIARSESDAAIQRTRSGIPHYDSDWIATPLADSQ